MRTNKMLAQNIDGKVHYRQEGRFVKEDVKKFYRYQFEVPQGSKEIQFIFNYSPKVLKDSEKNKQLIKEVLWEYLEEYSRDNKVKIKELSRWGVETIFDLVYPIRNLLDVSFYDAEGSYLGTFIKSGETARVNEREASPGLTPRRIKPGIWTVEIAVASIVTDECYYRMEISLLQKESEIRKEKKVMVNPLVKKRREEIKEKKSRWYAGELHVHSNHSDGKNSIDEIIEKARVEDLDFFALTDHNVVTGHAFIPQESDFPVIRGIEITTFYGHALGLGIRSPIDWRRDGEVRNINDVIDEVHAQGALFSLAHPFSIGDPLCVGCTWKFGETDYRRIDMIEIWCDSWRLRKIENYRSFKLWDRLLNEGLKITGISGRDWHDVNKIPTSGCIPKTFVLADSLSEGKLLQGLRKGHVFVSSGPIISFSAEHTNSSYLCGDEIKTSIRGESINFTVKVENLQTPAQLRVIKNGFVFYKKDLLPSKELRVSFSDIPDLNNCWYRCEIYTADKERNLLCFTNPIYYISSQVHSS